MCPPERSSWLHALLAPGDFCHFRRAAAEEGLALNSLAERIDEARGDVGLASAIRVHLLERALARGTAP